MTHKIHPDFIPGIPDIKPRTIVTFGPNGERLEEKGVLPSPFGPERSREIWAAALASNHLGGVIKCLADYMTAGERAYVMAVWDAVPSGESTWFNAFLAIRAGRVPAPESPLAPPSEADEPITIRWAGPTSWIAYKGRQAIWEDTTERQLLAKLKEMGYRPTEEEESP